MTVLLVNADFLASDFIVNEELPALLKSEDVVVIPVVLGPCRYAESSLSQFQALNDPKRPL